MSTSPPWAALALAALGQQMERGPLPFTPADLLSWAPGLGAIDAASQACEAMHRQGLLRPALRTGQAQAPQAWTPTTEGREALRAAAQAGSAGLPPAGDALALRLWRLLRMRTSLTAGQAVSVLADAGGSTRGLQARISAHLRQWARLRPDAVQTGARRVNGCVRYVLVQDAGTTPPVPTKDQRELP